MAPLADPSRTPQDTTSPRQLRGADRLIVALDVPTVDAALRTVDQLDNVSFFKVGLQLFIVGGLPTLLQSLRTKNVFVDLKVPGDIGNTIRAVIEMCIAQGVTLLTLSESMPAAAIRTAAAARNAHQRSVPKLLTVPFLSSLDAGDLGETTGASDDLETYVLRRSKAALDAGCDGVIASGPAIQWCRTAFPRPTLIVSPGIRFDGATTDDHKRHTTPAEAIRLGADYLVVGRPILHATDPRAAADRVIREIDAALPPVVGE
jgi:orotidine-5'-phosphate decarboxylase